MEASTSSEEVEGEDMKDGNGRNLDVEFCLICSGPTETNQIKTFPMLPGCEGNVLLNQQMWSVFILRKLLQYPQTKFSLLMKETFGVLNPASWFDICEGCTEIVLSGMSVFSKIVKLNYELKSVRKNLETIFDESLKTEMVQDVPGIVCPRESIRQHFKDMQTLKSEELEIGPKIEDDDEQFDNCTIYDVASYDEYFTHIDEDDETVAMSDSGSFIQDYETTSGSDPQGGDAKSVAREKHFLNANARSKKQSRKDKLTTRLIDSSGLEINGELLQDPLAESDPEWVKSTPKLQKCKTIKKKKTATPTKNSDDPIVRCELCPTQYTSFRSMERHTLHHKIFKEFACPLCNYPASGNNALRLHLQRGKCKIDLSKQKLNNERAQLTDPDCDNPALALTSCKNEDAMSPTSQETVNKLNSFQSLRELSDSRHQLLAKLKQLKPTGKISKQCEICSRFFSNPDAYRLHLESHKKNVEFSCEKCKYPCSSAQSLSVHLKSNCGQRYQGRLLGKVPKYNCNVCDFTTNKRYKLTVHMRNGHPIKKVKERLSPSSKSVNGNKKTKLEFAKKRLKSASNETAATNPETFLCALCPYSTTSKKSLVIHQRKHKIGSSASTDHLEIIGEPLSDPLAESDSEWVEPTPERQKSKVTKKSAVSSKNDAKPLVCELCPKQYTSSRSMERHILHHKTFKEFSCPLCNYPASGNNALRLHLQRGRCKIDLSKQKLNNERAQLMDPVCENPSLAFASSKIEDGVSPSPSPVTSKETISEHTNIKSSNEVSDSCHELLAKLKQLKTTDKISKECEICSRWFTNQDLYRMHLESHKKNVKFSCKKCKYPCSSTGALTLHLKSNCGQRYQERLLGKVPKYKCNVCDFTTNIRYKLSVHMSHGHPIQKDEGSSPSVSKQVNAKTAKIKSKSVKKRRKPKPVSNESHITKFTSTTNTNDQTPTATTLTTRKTFHCELCPYSTIKKVSFVIHQRNHKIWDGTETPDGKWKCNLCEEEFVKKRRLSVHKRQVHASEVGIDSFPCSMCSKSYSTKPALRDHINQVHHNKCRFYCEICGYGTINKYAFGKHKARHTKERSYVCEVCGSKYSFPDSLRQHIQKHHSENSNAEKPSFKCKYCENEFLSKGLLNLHHKEAHADLFIHKCDECENSYMSVASLQLHKKINHTNNTAKCQFCGSVVNNPVYLYSHYKNVCKKMPPGFKYTVPRGGKAKRS